MVPFDTDDGGGKYSLSGTYAKVKETIENEGQLIGTPVATNGDGVVTMTMPEGESVELKKDGTWAILKITKGATVSLITVKNVVLDLNVTDAIGGLNDNIDGLDIIHGIQAEEKDGRGLVKNPTYTAGVSEDAWAEQAIYEKEGKRLKFIETIASQTNTTHKGYSGPASAIDIADVKKCKKVYVFVIAGGPLIDGAVKKAIKKLEDDWGTKGYTFKYFIGTSMPQ